LWKKLKDFFNALRIRELNKKHKNDDPDSALFLEAKQQYLDYAHLNVPEDETVQHTSSNKDENTDHDDDIDETQNGLDANGSPDHLDAHVDHKDEIGNEQDESHNQEYEEDDLEGLPNHVKDQYASQDHVDDHIEEKAEIVVSSDEENVNSIEDTENEQLGDIAKDESSTPPIEPKSSKNAKLTKAKNITEAKQCDSQSGKQVSVQDPQQTSPQL